MFGMKAGDKYYVRDVMLVKNTLIVSGDPDLEAATQHSEAKYGDMWGRSKITKLSSS